MLGVNQDKNTCVIYYFSLSSATLCLSIHCIKRLGMISILRLIFKMLKSIRDTIQTPISYVFSLAINWYQSPVSVYTNTFAGVEKYPRRSWKEINISRSSL